MIVLQINELMEILGAMMFDGNTIVAGLMLTGLIIILLIGLVSMANPPPMAYILISFMGVLIAMGLGWLDYWLAILIGLVCLGALSMRLADMFRS